MDGFLLVNKEKNISSFGVVSAIKKKFNVKKVGHTGTLDPDTTGLLVIAIGRATKFISELSSYSFKEYEAVMEFGKKTTTGDLSGDVIIKDDSFIMDKTKVLEVFKSFEKKYLQIPPIYSAKKINGKRAYDYAFNNQEIDMSIRAKEVEIFKLEILNIDDNSISFKAKVSKGTYIRSLIEDIASELNTVAYMSKLKRTKTDGFDVTYSKKIDDLDLSDIISLESFLLDKYENVIEVDSKIANLIKNGVHIENENILKKFGKIKDETKILFVDKSSKNLIAIYEYNCKKIKPIFMVWR